MRDRDLSERLALTADPCDVVIFSIPWAVDHEAEEGERPNSLIRCRVTVNGVEVPGLLGAETKADAGFSEVTLRLGPSSIEFRAISGEEFYAETLPIEATR